jgi:hypothetical protein
MVPCDVSADQPSARRDARRIEQGHSRGITAMRRRIVALSGEHAVL